MKLFNKVFSRFKQSAVKKVAVSAAVFMALTGASVAGVTALQTTKVAEAASACGSVSSNSIISGGASSRSSFISKVKGSSELKAIYDHFGLSASDYSRFVSEGKRGVAYDNNTIVVDGRVVATNVGSIGRLSGCQGSNFKTFTIGGKHYYGNVNSKAFSSSTHAIPVDVLFDDKGVMQFAVMTGDCGNPTYQTPVKPTYACNNLTPKSLGNNKYSFTTDASAGHGASIAKLVYNFGDGSTATTTNPATAVTHTFTKDSTVSVTVYVNVPGGNVVKLSGGDCVKHINFTPPPAVFACNLLTLTPGKVDATTGATTYTLAAKASATNATIKSYTFDFGDTSANKVVTTGATTASTTHIYKPGTWTAKVSVTVVTNTGATKTVTSANCAQTIKVKVPECKPGVPMGSPQCSTLACVNLSLTAGTPDATTGATPYTLSAQASVDNATVTSYVFNFGDQTANQTVTTGALTASTTHTYKVGTFTATVTVNGKDASGKAITAAANAYCSKTVTVKTLECKPGVPVGSPECKPSNLVCVNLAATPGTTDNEGNQSYTFTATASTDNATVTNYVFNFGDNNQTQTVTTGATTATSQAHTYAPGTYTASVTVNGKDAKGNPVTAVANVNCSKTITVKPSECKPGVPTNSAACYTCDAFTVTKGDNRLVTIASFTATPSDALTSVTVNWGDNTSDSYTPATVVGKTHQFTADNTYKIVATAHFTVNGSDTPVTSDNCAQSVSFTTTPPPTTLVNTGAGSVAGIFAAAAIVGTLGHRLFLARRLNQNS